MLGPGEVGVTLQKRGCRLLGALQNADVLGEVGDFKVGQAVLPLTEEVTGAAQAQVFLSDLKPVRLMAQRV